MINLFHIPTHKIDTSKFDHQLNGSIVQEVECQIAEYLGCKYTIGFSSATNAIMLALWNKKLSISLPTELPSVVANAVLLGRNSVAFYDDPYWVGGSYILYSDGHKFGYRNMIIDSAQEIFHKQFKIECQNDDLLIHSTFPTKPLSGADGGFISTNNKEKANYFRCLINNGNSNARNSWDRTPIMLGFKMYMSSCQAYIIQQNLKTLQKKLDRLAEIRSIYNKIFNLCNSSSHLYRINVKNQRVALRQFYNQGITCGIHYGLLHKNPLYCQTPKSLPKSEWDSSTTISIPFHERLTKNEISHVIKNVQKHIIYN